MSVYLFLFVCLSCVFQKYLILLRNSIVILQSSNKRVLIRMSIPPDAETRRHIARASRVVKAAAEA